MVRKAVQVLTTMTTKAELRSMACSMFMATPPVSIDRDTPTRSLPITDIAYIVHIAYIVQIVHIMCIAHIVHIMHIVHVALTWYSEPLRHARHVMPLNSRPLLPRSNRLRLCPFLDLPTQMPPAHEVVCDQVETHDVHGNAE